MVTPKAACAPSLNVLKSKLNWLQYKYSKTSLNRPTMEPTLSGRFRELEYHCNGIIWMIVRDTNKAIDTGEWSICGDGRFLDRFYYII